MRPFRITSFVVLTALGVAVHGWFGVIAGVVAWIGFRLLMRAHPFPIAPRPGDREALRADASMTRRAETPGDSSAWPFD